MIEVVKPSALREPGDRQLRRQAVQFLNWRKQHRGAGWRKSWSSETTRKRTVATQAKRFGSVRDGLSVDEAFALSERYGIILE